MLPNPALDITRRHFFRDCGVGLGKIALAGLLTEAGRGAACAATDAFAVKKPHFAAKAKRVIHGLRQLDGIAFVARIMVEPASNPSYKDANKLANVVTPDEPQYAAVLRGETVSPDPVNAKPRKVEAAPAAPAWTTPAPAAAVTPWGAQASPASTVTPAPAGSPAPATTPAPAATPTWLKG